MCKMITDVLKIIKPKLGHLNVTKEEETSW